MSMALVELLMRRWVVSTAREELKCGSSGANAGRWVVSTAREELMGDEMSMALVEPVIVVRP